MSDDFSGSSGQKRMRGQPLMMLAVLLLGWVGMRIVLWTEPYAMPVTQFAEVVDENEDGAPSLVARDRDAQASGDEAPQGNASGTPSPSGDSMRDDWMMDQPLPLIQPAIPSALPVTRGSPVIGPVIGSAAEGGGGPAAPNSSAPAPARMIVGHSLMLVAGLSHVEMPPLFQAYLDNFVRKEKAQLALVEPAPMAARLQPSASIDAANRSQSRWSADGWLHLRRDTTTPVLSGRPSYGRSQAGAVLRYRLAPNLGNKPQAYVRVSSAIEGAKDHEVSAGISVRPLAKVPVRVAGELRASQTLGGNEIRPAVFAVSEFPPLDGPLGTRANIYVQAGYVGGNNATTFADGQMRVTKPIAKMGPARLDAGGGVWGGAQNNGERLDIGPSASVTFDLGKARSKLAVDYRFRVAGDAEPSSGPALTLSAGF